MRLLDRYLLRQVALPFAYCLLGFLAIWFVFDLADNLQDFLQARAPLELLLRYYSSQIPAIVVMSLPVAFLLAILYALTRMSRRNELTAMINAGVSIPRMLIPLILAGLLLSAVNMAFNYAAAPHAAAHRKAILREIRSGKPTETTLSSHLFRNREDRRTWFIGYMLPAQNTLDTVFILQEDENQRLIHKWEALRAIYQPDTKDWYFFRLFQTTLDPQTGAEIHSEFTEHKTISGLSETPWRISSSVMDPDFLSVPEIETYLFHNADLPERRLAPYRTHWHYRWALPLACLVVVPLAAPLAISTSRRGLIGSIATAIALFFLMVFLSSLMVALGKGARVPPAIAAWFTPALFLAIGIILVWFRTTGREFPELRMPWS